MKNYLWVIELKDAAGFWTVSTQAFLRKVDAVEDMKQWLRDFPGDVMRVVRYVRER